MCTILLLICFLLSNVPFPLYVNWNGYLIYNIAQILCNFHFLMWLLLLIPHPFIGPFIFRDLVYHYWLVDTWSGSILPDIQELQAIAMMLHRMVFHLSSKVVAMDNSTAKAYMCNQGGTVSPFLSRLACWILSLTNKHGITFIPA